MERLFEPARSPAGWARVAFAALMGLGGLVLAVVAALGVLEDPRITYRIAAGELTVRGGWPNGRRTVALARVAAVREVDLGDGWRTFGTGAPGLCTGDWSYPRLGPVCQVTDCSDRALLLVRDDGERPIAITPADPAAFTAALAARADGVFEPPAQPEAAWRWIGALLFTGPLVLWSIAAYAILGPRRLRYGVGGGDLVVRGALRTRRYALAGRTARRGDATAWLRLFGTSLPGFHVGLFRQKGFNARLAATRLDDGVHLDGRPALFVSPADVDGFLAALRENGAAVVPAPSPASASTDT